MLHIHGFQTFGTTRIANMTGYLFSNLGHDLRQIKLDTFFMSSAQIVLRPGSVMELMIFSRVQH